MDVFDAALAIAIVVACLAFAIVVACLAFAEVSLAWRRPR